MADGDGVEDALGSIAGAEVAAALAMEAAAQDEGNSFLSAFGTESPGRDHIVDEVRRLMKGIVEARPNVPAALLNRFASIVEQEEARYQQKLGFPQNSTRSAHTIGKLLVTIRDDDDFFDMLTSSLLLEGPVSSRAAAARALLTCMSCWAYTCTFEDVVLSMIKQLVMEDLEKSCSEGPNFRSKDKNANAKDSEVLSTYAIGLFACALSGTDTAEEILSSGLPAKFMRHLRLWTLGESGKSDHGHGGDGKANGYKSREEVRIRARQPPDAVEKRAISFEGDTDASGRMIDDHQSVDEDEADDAFTDERRRRKERNEGKSKPPSSHHRDENDIGDRGGGRSRGKSRVSDGGDIERSARKEKGRPKVDQNLPNAEDASKVYMADKVDISVSARRAVLAAQNEAKSANAPDEAIKAAGDAAAELVKAAALEALDKTDDIEAVLTAAEAAANSVVDAAASVVRKEDQPEETTAVIPDSLSVDNEVDDHALDWETLAFLKARYCVQCLEKLGEYIDILGPVLQERGVEVCLELLRRHSRASDSVRDMAMVSDVLRLVCALAAHRKFAAVFVDLGGMQQLLVTPRLPQTYVGISLCLFAVASLQGVMERVCALSPSVVQDTVALAFQLLECSQDTARKNAALFFGASFVFRAVIEAFDSQDGLRKILNLLQHTINVRSGVSTNLMAPGISRVDRGASAEVLTASDKQITYHACVALRQYFRASFLILVDSLRACKNYRGALRNLSNPRKPIDVSNEAIETVVQQLSRDRKLGTAFVRAKWPALENFIFHNGHVTLLELTQAAPGEKYLHDIAHHALVVLHVVTLMPSARRHVVGSSLGNGRPGMSVILDAASGAAFVEPEVIQAALLILVNLVCPPPAFSSRSVLSTTPAGLVTPAPTSVANGQNSEPKEKLARTDDCAGALALCSPASTIVGDTRISLGPGSGGPGLAAHMEQGYRFARESVRANNGIKVLLHLLYPRTVLPACAHDCIRALACRVLLGLARDEAIAQILTKLQVGKLLSELLRDGSHAHRQTSSGGDQDRWQTELSQVALDLIGIVTNAGRAGTVASEAAAPTLRRIERAAIAAATPINYHSRELLQLIHEHLSASGLTNTATLLLKEAKLTSLGSLLPVSSLSHSFTAQESLTDQKELQWPSGRVAGGALLGNKQATEEDKMCMDRRKTPGKPLITPRKTINGKEPQDSHTAASTKVSGIDDSTWKTPRTLPMKRKATEKDALPASPNKRPHLLNHTGASSGFSTPQVRLRNNFPGEATSSTSDMSSRPPMIQADDSVEHPSLPMCSPCYSHPSLLVEQKAERATLDSLVVQYLKHQHRQCPAPITTLPPLSLLHPHLCPEPSRLLYAPYNTTSRLAAREIFPPYGGLHGRRHNRHFIYSRFRQVRVSRDEVSALLTCATFLGQSGCLAAGCHSGSIRLFDINTGNIIENHQCHLTAVSVLQSASHLLSGDNGTGPLLLSSGTFDARLWNSSSMVAGPLHTFENCKAARFNHAGTMIGALKPDSPKEVLLYDVSTYTLQQTLTESSISTAMSARNQPQPFVHFSPSDILVLWSGVLWDHRIPRAVHRFDQFTDYGGGGFHPAGNEVIINSEVWDLRTFKLLRSVPSLDQTALTFNASGDVIYAILRRNADDVTTALQHKRTRHPLFSAFRTMDAVDYSDIATTQVDRCVLDLTTECSDSMIGLVAMEASQGLDSCVKFYEVGRKRPTDDDSDPDDGMDTDEEEESDVDEDDEHRLLDGDSDSNDDGDDEDDDNVNEDFGLSDDNESEGGVPGGLLEIIDEDDDDDRTSYSEGSDTEFGDDEEFNGILQGFM